MITAHQCAHLADDRKKLGGENLYYFDGDAYGTSNIPSSALPTGYSGPHTLAFWLYYESLISASYQSSPIGLIGNSNSVIRSLIILFSISNKLSYFSGDGTNYQRIDTGYNIPQNQWIYIIIFSDGSTVSMYLNGLLYGPYALSYQPTVTDTDIDLMYYSGYNRYIKGYLKNVTLYDRVLTSTARTIFANDGIPGHPVLYYPCNEGTGDSFKDHSRSRGNVTLNNGVWQYTDPEDGRIWI